MSDAGKSIFRPEALARYTDQKQEAVFPKIIGPGLFPKLWVIIVLLFAGLFLVGWIPVKQEHRTEAVLIAHQNTQTTMIMAIPAVYLSRVTQGLEVRLNQGGAQIFEGTITYLEGPFKRGAAFPEGYQDATAHLPERLWPIMLVSYKPKSKTRSPKSLVPTKVTLTHPPLRIFNYLPLINSNN